MSALTPALITPQAVETAASIAFATIGVLGVAVAMLITIGVIVYFLENDE